MFLMGESFFSFSFLPTKPLFSPERGQRFISSHLWRWHSGVEAMWAPKCFSLFFMNGIKKGTEKSSIPPQPSILLNHQCPSDSASKSPSQFSPVTHRRPATRTRGWELLPCMKTCSRETCENVLEHAQVCEGPCNRWLWKQSLYDDVLKQLQEGKNVASYC